MSDTIHRREFIQAAAGAAAAAAAPTILTAKKTDSPLVIGSGEHRYERKTEEQSFFRTEFRYGKFQRVIPLPVAIQNDRVQADFTNGILTLTLPKVQSANKHVVKLNLAEQPEPAEALKASNEQPVSEQPTEAVLASNEHAVNTETNDLWESQAAEPTAV